MTYDQLRTLWARPDGSNLKSEFLMMVLIGLVLGIISPYESSDLPFPLLRFAYWQVCILLGWLMAVPIARIVFPYMEKKDVSPMSGFLWFCCAIAMPIFLLVVLLDFMIFSFLVSGLPFFSKEALFGFLERIPNHPDSIYVGLVVWYLQVLIIVFLVFGATTLLDEKFGKTQQSEAQISTKPGQVFLDRLPADMSKEISCLSVEDHYVRVYAGSEDYLLLMRMADAVAELADYAGMQVHRSWWVAFDAIEKRERDGRRYVLTLKDGHKVPVSKTYLAAVKEQGF